MLFRMAPKGNACNSFCASTQISNTTVIHFVTDTWFLVIYCIRLALHTKAADVYAYLYCLLSDGQTWFPSFAPTAVVAHAPLSKPPRVRSSLGQPIRAGSHPATVNTWNCDPCHTPRHPKEPVLVMVYLIGRVDQCTEESTQLRCSQ